MLFNTNYSIYHRFICIHLNGFKYRKWMNIYIWPIGTTTPGQSGPGSNGNVVVQYIPQNTSIISIPSESLES